MLAMNRGELCSRDHERENPMTDSGVRAEAETVKYDTRSIQTVRGSEKLMIAKWEKDGWEIVAQNTGKLRTELVFRRPKPPFKWKPLAVIGGVLVVLFTFIGIMAAVTGGDDNAPTPADTASAEAVAPRDEPSAEPEEPIASAPAEETPADLSTAVPITVDELLDKLNSADMGGIRTGDLFTVTGELFMSDLWTTGATGDYFVMLKAQGGAQDLTVFADESEAAGWTDGTKVEMVLRAEEATIDGETSGGWLRAVSTTVLP